ncbi:uncharacterized protein LOC141617527 [Silene latifolia]|uniref:uncharacterized protein LOC141617527 n=1 Tax=Silene latifolia TaxID=37657 RepID=UPI003D77B3F4
MNNPNKQLDIKRLLYQNKVGLFGLVETKIKEHDFLTVLHRLGHYWEGVNNNSHHPGGRVWVIWLPQLFSIHLLASSDQHITVEVTEISSGDSFGYTVVYGFNSDGERQGLWSQLNNLKDNCTKPWCICGDFNSLLNYNERLGSDDPTTGVLSRIDRFLVNIDWMLLYPDSKAYFMNEGNFDHCPCIVSRKPDIPARKPSFRYFNMWSLDPQFMEIIQHEWNRTVVGVKMYQVVTKLRNLKKPLKLLNKNKFSDVERTADMSRLILDDLQTQLHQNPHDNQLSLAEREAADSYATLQKDPQDIEKAFMEYYEGLLGTSSPTTNVHKANVRTGKVIDESLSHILLQPVTHEEIKACFFSIPASKSLGPDGFNSQFFKDSWDIVGPGICDAIKDFFSTGKRGLRQGDPLSPLLFTICMDYLSRILNVIGQQDDFKFHPLCGHLKLNHLLFADDLLLFSKGTDTSIMWLLRAFATFSAASGLCLNKEKTEIYFNGAQPQTVEAILQVSGFKKGSLPFKYLGVPISSKKLTKTEGRKLIDKITARIRSWGANHLSYAGRLTLVTSVLQSLHSYWSNIFLIPNGIMNRIDSLCRNFLWGGGGGKDSYLRAPAVSWDKCCLPKSEGGLGIKHSKNWNKALLGKYVWWIASKKDHLWVKWISHVYLKDTHWTDYNPPPDCSWSWKKIAHIMSIFRPAYSDDCWMGKQVDYSVNEGYKWLRGPNPEVSWWRVCWNSMNVPKTSFIYWAVVLRRLLTKDRLVRMGGASDLSCFLCHSHDESHDHLFFDCLYSNRCVQLLQHKLQFYFDPHDLVNWSRKGRRNSLLVRRVTCSCYIQLIYLIWQERNKARLYSKVTQPGLIVNQGIQSVCTRFRTRNKAAITRDDEVWLHHLSQLFV